MVACRGVAHSYFYINILGGTFGPDLNGGCVPPKKNIITALRYTRVKHEAEETPPFHPEEQATFQKINAALTC